MIFKTGIRLRRNSTGIVICLLIILILFTAVGEAYLFFRLKEKNENIRELRYTVLKDREYLYAGLKKKVTETKIPEVLCKDYSYSFDEVTVNGAINTGDIIDIRISFSDGEDYAVLKGIEVESISEREVISASITEEELLRLSSAVRDKKEHKDAFVYAIRFMGQRSENGPDYIPNANVLLQLGGTENDYTERKRLEERLSKEADE